MDIMGFSWDVYHHLVDIATTAPRGTSVPTTPPQADPDRGDPAADGETPLTTVLSEGPEGPRLQLLRRLVEAMADPHQARRGFWGDGARWLET
jgi:hypothetical protein